LVQNVPYVHILLTTSAGGLYFDKHTPQQGGGESADRQKYEKGEKEGKYEGTRTEKDKRERECKRQHMFKYCRKQK
jgi:hypothetical protein